MFNLIMTVYGLSHGALVGVALRVVGGGLGRLLGRRMVTYVCKVVL